MRGAVYLDSSDHDFGERSRWSILSACPSATICYEAERLTVSRGGEVDQARGQWSDPFEALRSFLSSCNDGAGRDEGTTPAPLASAAIGYIGYEMGRFIEQLPERPRPLVAHPEMWFGYYPTVLAYRHSDQSWWLRGSNEHGHDLDLSEVLLRATIDAGEPIGASVDAPIPDGPARITPDTKEYVASVERILSRIRAGDFYQANLTRQVEASFKQVDPVSLYLRLRSYNPAPFSAALKVDRDGPWILSSSPERFLRVTDGVVETRPIKGTVPREGDPLTDRANREALTGSSKDAAELAMIVDVLRNDLGRVCDYGSIRLAGHRNLEAYARVYHLVSSVTGKLREEADVVDLLRAAFPGGSITGAPKIKAMECLAELEPFGRGAYTGAIGYVGPNGDADFSIAIRTMVLSENRVSFGIGGGVVADSNPESEREETLVKGSALMGALGIDCPIE